MVGGEGLEPSRVLPQQILSLSCLPVSATARMVLRQSRNYPSSRQAAFVLRHIPQTKDIPCLPPESVLLAGWRTGKTRLAGREYPRTKYRTRDAYLQGLRLAPLVVPARITLRSIRACGKTVCWDGRKTVPNHKKN